MLKIFSTRAVLLVLVLFVVATSNMATAETCKNIDYSKAEVRPATVKGKYVLTVSGTKTHENMDVKLTSVIYIRRPEYWLINVTGCLTGVGLPATAPYAVTRPLDGIRGTEGIEVQGASSNEKIKI